MTINTARFLAASRTATDSTTDLVDFKTFLAGLCDYWRTSDGDDVAMETVLEELEEFGESRTAWLSALEAFTSNVEKRLLIALEGDEGALDKDLAEDVLLLETLDGALSAIENCFATVDHPSLRNDMIYAMVMALDPTISARGNGIIADSALEFRADERRAALRPRRTSLKPVAFHYPGRMAEELEDGFPDADICRCGECLTRRR